MSKMQIGDWGWVLRASRWETEESRWAVTHTYTLTLNIYHVCSDCGFEPANVAKLCRQTHHNERNKRKILLFTTQTPVARGSWENLHFPRFSLRKVNLLFVMQKYIQILKCNTSKLLCIRCRVHAHKSQQTQQLDISTTLRTLSP